MCTLFQIMEQTLFFSFFVSFDGVFVPFNDFISHRLWLQNLYPLPTSHNCCFEISSRFQIQFEVRKLFRLINFTLAMMQGQVTKIITLIAMSSQHNTFTRNSVINNDTIAIVKEFCGIKALIHLELRVKQFHIFYTIKRVNTF